MSPRLIVAHNLAAAYLAGERSVFTLFERLSRAWGKEAVWLRNLVRRIYRALSEGTIAASQGSLVAFIERDRPFRRAWQNRCRQPSWPAAEEFWKPPRTIAPNSVSWNLPKLTTPGCLADWLGIGVTEMDWFANCRGQDLSGPLSHYTYRWRAKRRGKFRLLEIPKQRLKEIQRLILHEVLDRIPPHDAVHSYRPGRSVATYAAPHCGQHVVLHMDLCDFFPSLRRARVEALFQTLYPQPVARLLAGLCTNTVPRDVLPRGPVLAHEPRYVSRHVPQGAPTSPALGNLCGYRLDCRLHGLAQAVGGHYTRYADDLTFSGSPSLAARARRFHVYVCRIVLEEGFEIRTRKTRLLRQGVRQRIAGVVVNVRLNIARAEYDRLKATLFNCARHGPASQNREARPDFRAYLMGRIGYVRMLHPERGERLRALFDRVIWSGPMP